MLLILRHLESKKNILKQFSSLEDGEELTKNGSNMGNEIAQYITTFVKTNSYNVKKVYCANSLRAIKTAKIIADKLKVEISALNELRSNNSGSLRGKSETEALTINPLFIKQLKLFRAGIYSSYNFVDVIDREDKHDFEKRVAICLNSIISQDSGDLQIIVLHHSSLTAAIIHFARTFYNYPQDYYGYIACELGNIYLISDDDIILCNEPASILGDIKIQ